MSNITKNLSALVLGCVLTLLLVAGCDSAQTSPSDEQDNIPRAQYHYENKCTRCHDYYDPREFRQKTMRYNFKKYAAKAGIKKEDRALVLNWALAQCRDAPLANTP